MQVKVTVIERSVVTGDENTGRQTDFTTWKKVPGLKGARILCETFGVEASGSLEPKVIVGSMLEMVSDPQAVPNGPVSDVATFTSVRSNEYYKASVPYDVAATNSATSPPLESYVGVIVDTDGTSSTGGYTCGVRVVMIGDEVR